jgi:hypothetical protein
MVSSSFAHTMGIFWVWEVTVSNLLVVQQRLWATSHKKKQYLFGAHVFQMRSHGPKAMEQPHIC